MTTYFASTRDPNRATRKILAVAAIWTVLIMALVLWWGWVLRKQADRIVELERVTGIAAAISTQTWDRTHRMLMWESWTFVLLLLALTALLVWLYWRDVLRSRSLQAFFASVTHELKTPLTSIRLQTESIADQGVRPELIERLLEDTSRLEGQVERTLELARLEGGGKLACQSLPLRAWLDRSLGYLARSYGKRAHFQLVPGTDAALILADSNALQVILKNIVENSVRYSGKNPVQIVLQIENRDPFLVLSFRDNGKGGTLSGRNLGQLFQRGADSQGAGVGLYLVKALMERMGGRAVFQQGTPQSGFVSQLWFRVGD